MKKLFSLLSISTILINATYAQTLGSGVTDIDGNTYGSVIIGSQEWMSENLRVTQYNDGTSIPNITDATDWGNDTFGAWANYDNSSTNNTTYGKLYNGYVTDNANTKNVCPSGWHIPVRADFSDMITYLGDTAVAGAKLKETGTTQWSAPSAGTNTTGFTGLPGGIRSAPIPNVNFNGLGTGAGFWASDFHAGGQGGYWCLYLSHADDSALVNFSSVKMGLSVRCLKDETTNKIEEKENIQQHSIYPNPATDYFTISGQKINDIKIYDLNNRLIHNATNLTNQNQVDISFLPKGVYVILIDNQTKLKFVKI